MFLISLTLLINFPPSVSVCIFQSSVSVLATHLFSWLMNTLVTNSSCRFLNPAPTNPKYNKKSCPFCTYQFNMSEIFAKALGEKFWKNISVRKGCVTNSVQLLISTSHRPSWWSWILLYSFMTQLPTWKTEDNLFGMTSACEVVEKKLLDEKVNRKIKRSFALICWNKGFFFHLALFRVLESGKRIVFLSRLDSLSKSISPFLKSISHFNCHSGNLFCLVFLFFFFPLLYLFYF